ncbi:hypothetical protein DDZ14_15960 [Maritimibacter sp. 55A14]|uniref:esterase-like activity of phytase family protein n=1 Tax=Maritimibacter sp. 55A14 TaxID=2174844 RepID=UPI000D61127E|nr:esterase-like activity of phytase family protein [Maritimibacter sp. 55A14]PWE30052.1 hypothetical protein DDZ14_15960 [Maritimibacter sp. 55A14]
MHRRPGLGLTLATWLLACGGAAAAERLVHVGSYHWPAEKSNFGGFSGLEIDADGRSFTAISDQGQILTGRLDRGPEGVVTGVRHDGLRWIRDVDGAPVRDTRIDAEGLAVAADGRLYISYERDHRVDARAGPDAVPEALPVAPAFAGFQGNSGLEALALDPDGRLFAIPERSGEWIKPYPVFVFANGAWTQPYSLPRRDRYLPVGADFGPDGRLYLLERDFRGVLTGVSSRIRVFAPGPDGLRAEATLLETPYGTHDNLEAIAIWQEPGGTLRATLLSDDNFNPAQRTEFVDYRLEP